MSDYISKINTYRNHKGIELHEEELVDGKFPAGKTVYTAIITIGVNIEGQSQPMPKEITAKFHAVGVSEAFKKAEKELQKEIEAFQKQAQEEMNAAMEEMREEELGPRIITPGS